MSKASEQTTVQGYKATAYNSQNITLQERQASQPFSRRMKTRGHRFSFSQANDSLSLCAIRDITPKDAVVPEDDDRPAAWSHKSWVQEDFTAWGQLYAIVVGMARVSLMFFLPLLYMIFLSVLAFGDRGFINGWNSGIGDSILALTFYATLPCLLIHAHSLLVNRGWLFLAPFLKPKLICEFNRQTGMVTRYTGRGKQVRYCHHFTEFDCVLMSSPSHQGLMSYSLVLIHRYEDYSVGVPLSHSMLSPNEKQEEYLRFWNMVQRYMDISQPLPDILMLEESRHLDPTTIAYDKKHNRQPRYWRDMSEEEFKKAINDLWAKQNNMRPTGKPINIFKN